MGKINVGVIGIGCIAEHAHIPGILRSPDLELSALCDSDPEILERARIRYGVSPSCCFSDYRELVRCPSVDAVDICTPNHCHYVMALAAVEAGKPYSLEKPVTMTAAEAADLANCSARGGVKSMICFSYRFKAAARYARDLIAQGMLGELYHVSIQYLQNWGLPEKQIPLRWRFIKEETGSGALGDLGSHALDLCRFVTGKECVKLVAQADTLMKERPLENGSGTGRVTVDDYCNYMAELEDGASATFQITRFAFGRGNYQCMEVYGGKGALVYHLDRNPDEDELALCMGAPYEEAKSFIKLPIPDKYKSDQMQAFADLINGCGDGLTGTIEDGKINQIAVDAVLASSEQGRWISLVE